MRGGVYRPLKTVKQAGDAVGIVADAGTADGCAALIKQVPKVDILVNNLGIYEAKPFAEIPDEDWLKLFHALGRDQRGRA